MPHPIVTTWAHVEAGHTVLGRDGRPRLVLRVQHWYDAYRAWVEVTSAEGTFNIDPDQTAMIVCMTEREAVVEVLARFPGSEVIA